MERGKETSSRPRNSESLLYLLGILLLTFFFSKRNQSRQSVYPQDKATEDVTDIPEMIPNIEANAITATNTENKSYKGQDNPLWEKVAAIAQIIVAFVTLGLLVVNICQSRSTSVAAHAAKDAVERARKNAHLEQRAWVGVGEIVPETTSKGIVKIIFKNTGRTPAKNFVIKAAGEDVPKGGKPSVQESILPGRGIIAPDGSFHSSFKSPSTFGFVLHGRVDYDDVFGINHWTTFCYYFVPQGGFAPCDYGNDIDNNPPDVDPF